MATKNVVSRWVVSPSLQLRCLSICFVLVVMILQTRDHMVAGGVPAATMEVPSSITVPETIHSLDLSYLHRCGSGDIANAIRGTLEEEQRQRQRQQQDQITPAPTEGRSDDSIPIEDRAKNEEKYSATTVLNIDLTASLIGKNISEILSSLKRSEEQSQQAKASRYSDSSTIVRLTARRNQLSPGEATSVLDFVLENGPTNETTSTTSTTTTTTTITTSIAIDKKEIENEVSGNDNGCSSEIAAIELSEDVEPNGNATAAAATDLSMTASTVNSDSNDSVIHDDDDTIGLKTESSATSSAIKPYTKTRMRPAFVSIQSLDLSWNNLGASISRRSSANVRTLNGALRKLLADPDRCPSNIRLEACGLGPPACRELAKGIVERYQRGLPPQNNEDGEERQSSCLPPPLSLDLVCNKGIGDVGVAALAAAIRTVAPQDAFVNKEKKKRRKKKSSKQEPLPDEEKGNASNHDDDTVQRSSPTEQNDAASGIKTRTILERLDLSGCDIGDVGAEALAIALANHPLCVKHLDLSNNRITDQGAAALAQALGTRDSGKGGDESTHHAGLVETLDLSHNKDLGDGGAKKLALAFQRDGISRLILRSCNIRADGAACFGTALRSVGSRALGKLTSSSIVSIRQKRSIDLSGNPLGILSKKKKSGNKYSATALRSKATDTTKAYMNIIGKSLQKGLNSISGESGGLDTLESDDEEEGRMGEKEEADESMKKCGALSFAEAFIRDDVVEDTGGETTVSDGDDTSLHVELGLRHCSFDTRAAEALAAVLQESNQKYPCMTLAMDMTMNHVLEDDIVAALHGEEGYDDQLADMAEVYLDALEVMREARERALEASRMATARAKAQVERESAWGAPPPSSSRYNNDYGRQEWSNDVEDDYDDDDWDNLVDDSYERNNSEEDDYSDDNW